ncbi:MAG: amidohydrolase family protein [Chloroflexota bacterium]
MADLVITGGRVVDPGRGVDGAFDVQVRDGHIRALVPTGAAAAEPGATTLDASGALVLPGLIDLHGHWYDASPYGVDPLASLRGGATCAVDAGTAGYGNFEAFRRTVIEPSPVRVYAYVHVAAAGLAASMVGELEEIRYARPRETAAIIRAHRDVVIGVKVRVGSGACGANSDAALDRAVEAAELAGTPIMAHIADGADVPRVLRTLRPGDVVTHAFTGNGTGIFDAELRVLPEAREARRRGVLFDIGHGCGSFTWRTAGAAIDQGFPPDSISTDLHRYSITHPVIDLPTTMAKLAALGMAEADVLAAVTSRPAAAMQRTDVGSLAPGARADITLLRPGPAARLLDSEGKAREVAAPWRPWLALVDGEVWEPGSIEVRLREYVDADLEVDCTAPLT